MPPHILLYSNMFNRHQVVIYCVEQFSKLVEWKFIAPECCSVSHLKKIPKIKIKIKKTKSYYFTSRVIITTVSGNLVSDKSNWNNNKSYSFLFLIGFGCLRKRNILTKLIWWLCALFCILSLSVEREHKFEHMQVIYDF